MEFHPIANIFPLMEGEEYEAFKKDVKQNGLIEPIWLHPDGSILDGRNRWRACTDTNTNAIFKNYEGDLSVDALIRFVVSLNESRRHLTSTQKATCAVKADEIREQLKKEAKERMMVGKGDDGSGGRGNTKNPPQLIGEGFNDTSQKKKPTKKSKHKGESKQQTADLFKTNREYIAYLDKLKLEHPDLFDKAVSGEMTVPEIKKFLKEQKFKANLVAQKQAIENGEVELPTGLFEVISVDPPWPYGTEYDSEGRRAASPYPEMSLEDIANIELPLTDDCVVWLWTTHKFMRYSFEILDKWGVRDVAILTWEKNKMGLGSWLRSNSEFCIMAVRGKPLINLTNQKTVLHGDMREHSRKPESFYEMVNELCIGRKLDYFSREQRKGWSSFGNDVEKF